MALQLTRSLILNSALWRRLELVIPLTLSLEATTGPKMKKGGPLEDDEDVRWRSRKEGARCQSEQFLRQDRRSRL